MMLKSRIDKCLFKNKVTAPIYSSPKPKVFSKYFVNQSQRGLTLIEVLVTISIAALVTTMAVPSFSGMLEANRITSQTNDFVTAMVMARSEAIKRKANIDVIAIDASNNANEWGKGWIVAVNGGATLRIFTGLTGGIKLNSTGDLSSYQFNSNGRVNATDSLTLCLPEAGSTGRSISVSRIGRVSTVNTVCS